MKLEKLAHRFTKVSLLIGEVCHLLSVVIVQADQTERSTESGHETRVAARLRDYCLGSTEVFQATCMKNELIVMNSAVYGRMKLNRCLQNEGDILLQAANNPQFLGCSVDVLHVMDAKCSGLGSCVVRGTDPEFHQISPCWSALKNYLEVGYECVKVIEEDRSCSVSVTSSVQYLMSDRSSDSKLSCGSRHQPWKLEAPAGQQINVSLLDFRTKDGTVGCKPRGYILDAVGNKNITLCNSLQMRKYIFYSSSSNAISIVLHEQIENDERQGKLLIGLIAVGCSDVLAPIDSWMRRMEDEAVIGCYTSRQTWRLRCVNNQWRGVIGNCTREIANESQGSQNHSKPKELDNPNEVVVIVVIIVLTAIFCTFIICTGIVCIKRYYGMSFYKHRQGTLKNDQNGVGKSLRVGMSNDSAHAPILVQS